jgi:hypothetical protein
VRNNIHPCDDQLTISDSFALSDSFMRMEKFRVAIGSKVMLPARLPNGTQQRRQEMRRAQMQPYDAIKSLHDS